MRGASGLRRVLATVVVLAVLVALAAPLMATAAEVEPTVVPGGTVTGIVRDPYGVPITGDYESDYVIAVEVWQWDGDYWNHVYADENYNDFQVDFTNGEFAFDLPAGTYRLRFYDWFNRYSYSGYREEFYPSGYTVDDASDVVVTNGGITTANMTLALWEHGSAAGTVTNALTAEKAWGVQVLAYGDDGFGGWTWDGLWGATSLSMGDWAVTEAPVGRYKLEFSDREYYRYDTQWYGGDDIDTASWVTIAPMHTVSGLDAEMVPFGHIKGRLTDAGGQPIKGVYAQAFISTDGGWYEVSEGSQQKPSDANGYYDYIGLPAGTFRMVFWDPQGRYLQEVYNNISAPSMDPYQAAALPGATNITLTQGQTVSSINAQLAAGARIAGHVQDAAGPVPWTDVTIFDSATGAKRGLAFTDENGDYVLGNLLPGTYKVRFDFAGPELHDGYYPSESGDAGWYYTKQFYSAKTTTGTANAITLTSGLYGTPISATLAPTANWGTVVAEVYGGARYSRLSGIEAALDYDFGGGDYTEMFVGTTDDHGQYRFPYVPVGQVVRLRVNDPAGYMWDDRWDSATYTHTTGSGTWTAQPALAVASTDMNGEPLGVVYSYMRDAITHTSVGSVPMTLYQHDTYSDEWWWERSQVSDYSGFCEMPSLAGEHKLEAGATLLYGSEYFQNQSNPDYATMISVSPPAVTSTLVVDLDRAHGITGTVTDAGGDPVQGAYISALKYNSDWDVWEPITWDGPTNAFSAEDGSYSLGGLPNGTYRLVAYGWDTPLGTKAWKASGEAMSVDQADDIVLSGAAAIHTGYDFTMTPAADLHGSVTDADAKRVSGVHVRLWWDDPAGDWALVNSTYTYHDGDFAFYSMSAGDYYLEFVDDTNYLYEDSWYKDVATADLANAVTLADYQSAAVTQTVVSVDTTYSPVFGATRIQTAIKASEAAFPDGAKTVVIATGFNWPDALGGAALAGAYDGPILLTNQTYLPSEVADEIDRLGASDAIILGSSAAVGNPVESALKSTLGAAHVRRLAGANRYETAVKVAEETIDRLGAAYDGTAFVSTGENFPDALGASPLAAASNWPIYLTDAETLTTASRTSMQAHGVTDAIILGSTAAVSSGVETALNVALGGTSHTTRLGGANRYETAVIVAQYGVDHVYGLGWNNVAFATGENYPDALAGGVLQGQAGSVLLLTPTNSLHTSVAAKLQAVKDSITEVRYLGSTKAVSNAVRVSIQSILK